MPVPVPGSVPVPVPVPVPESAGLTYKVAPASSAVFFVDSLIVVLAPIFSTDS